MKKVAFVLLLGMGILIGCYLFAFQEPTRCAICDDLPRHAPCVINLMTGEKLELDIYEPHPFIVGEIAQKQPGGYFCFFQGAGIEGHKIAAESVVISIPVKTGKIRKRFFCSSCRELLPAESYTGYVLADLVTPLTPLFYSINDNTSFDIRCYNVSVQKITEENKYKIVIIGCYAE